MVEINNTQFLAFYNIQFKKKVSGVAKSGSLMAIMVLFLNKFFF